MRSLERRCHEEDPLYQVATYLASSDQLLDEQASILREQVHWAEQAELTIRMHQNPGGSSRGKNRSRSQ